MPAPQLALDFDKARAVRRAAVRRDIRQGLLSAVPAARETDPRSSHEAVEAIHENGQRASHQRVVLDMVRRLPGLTYRELAVQVGLERHEVMKRLNDLEKAAKIVKGEPRLSGQRQCVTWWPVNSGAVVA